MSESLDIEPISADEYYAGVETAASCDCGGGSSFDAPPRCPKCGSPRIEKGPGSTLLRLSRHEAHQCPWWTTSSNGRRFGLRIGLSGRSAGYPTPSK